MIQYNSRAKITIDVSRLFCWSWFKTIVGLAITKQSFVFWEHTDNWSATKILPNSLEVSITSEYAHFVVCFILTDGTLFLFHFFAVTWRTRLWTWTTATLWPETTWRRCWPRLDPSFSPSYSRTPAARWARGHAASWWCYKAWSTTSPGPVESGPHHTLRIVFRFWHVFTGEPHKALSCFYMSLYVHCSSYMSMWHLRQRGIKV